MHEGMNSVCTSVQHCSVYRYTALYYTTIHTYSTLYRYRNSSCIYRRYTISTLLCVRTELLNKNVLRNSAEDWRAVDEHADSLPVPTHPSLLLPWFTSSELVVTLFEKRGDMGSRWLQDLPNISNTMVNTNRTSFVVSIRLSHCSLLLIYITFVEASSSVHRIRQRQCWRKGHWR